MLPLILAEPLAEPKGVVKLSPPDCAESTSLVPPLPDKVFSPVSLQSMPLKNAAVWKLYEVLLLPLCWSVPLRAEL